MPRGHSTFVKIMGRIILFAIEGPRKPWWLPAAMAALGPILVVVSDPPPWTAPLAIAGFVVFAIGFTWWFMRGAQYAYVKELAAHSDPNTCPVCKYNLKGIPGDQCPECGTDRVKLKDAVDTVMKRHS